MSNSAATVDVAILVEPAIAVALADARTHRRHGPSAQPRAAAAVGTE